MLLKIANILKSISLPFFSFHFPQSRYFDCDDDEFDTYSNSSLFDEEFSASTYADNEAFYCNGENCNYICYSDFDVDECENRYLNEIKDASNE